MNKPKNNNRKKGFTLIEIIICITLLVIIGTASFFGIRLISKNITIKELIQIEDKLYEAANVYIETRTEAKHQLYQENNAVIIPLNVLKNEGLIKVDNIDIKAHYVLTLLGSEVKSQACDDISTIASWQVDTDKTIYLCTDVDLSGIEGELSTIETNIESILSRVSTLESSVSTISSKFSEYVKINDYNIKINSIENRLTELENGSTGNVIEKLTGDDGEFIARGINPNNYVKLENGENNWRIVEITNGNIYLIATDKNLLLTETEAESINSSKFYYKYIESSDYAYEYHGDSGTRGSDIRNVKYTTDLIGKLSYTGLMNATNTTGNWILNLLTDIKGETYSISLNTEGSNTTGCFTYDGYHKHYISMGYLNETYCPNRRVIPLAKLKATYTLADNPNCTTDGSSSCPYLIKNK